MADQHPAPLNVVEIQSSWAHAWKLMKAIMYSELLLAWGGKGQIYLRVQIDSLCKEGFF